MTVELWLGSDFEHRHEMDALCKFLGAMVDHYKDDANRYFVMANFIINNQFIDLAILKRNAVIVIEVKEVGGRVIGSENGPWMVRELGAKKVPLKGGGHGNPFLQVRKYHQTMIDYLRTNQRNFLNPRSGRRPALHHVAAYITLSPSIPEGSEINLPKKRWLRLLGLNELHLEVYRERSPELNFSNKEMYTLLQDVLRLRKTDIGKFIGMEKVREEADQAQASEQPHVVPVELEEVIAPERVIDLESVEMVQEERKEEPNLKVLPELPIWQPEIQPGCFVCRMSETKCDVEKLSGIVLEEKFFADGRKGFVLDTGSMVPVEIVLEGDWGKLVDKSVAVRQTLGSSLKKEPFSIVAYHLYKNDKGYVARDDSLVILEPNWLIKVTDLTQVDYCQRQLPLSRLTPFTPNQYSIRGSIVHQLFPNTQVSSEGESIERTLQKALESNAEIMIFANVEPGLIEEDVRGHLAHLLEWADSQQMGRSQFQSETFVLSPLVGLKGRIDGLWVQNDTPVILGELKTGKSYGAEPKPGHLLQLLSYELTVLSMDDVDPKTLYRILFYTGNDRLGTSGKNLTRQIRFNPEQMRRVVQIRNEIVLIDLTGEAQFETNLNKCRKCSQRLDCAKLAILGGHEDPRGGVG